MYGCVTGKDKSSFKTKQLPLARDSQKNLKELKLKLID